MATHPAVEQDPIKNFLEKEYKEISSELDHRMLQNDTWAQGMFMDNRFPTELIQQFLWESPLYDSEAKRWRHLVRNAIHECHLIVPLSNIITAIINCLGESAGSRSVRHDSRVDGLQLRNPQRERDVMGTDQLRMLPDITILGYGSSFSPASHIPKLEGTDLSTYANCVTPIHVKPSSYLHPNDIAQMALYARQCYRLQENRYFVFSLLLTEESVHLFLFDRSGCWYSRQIDIHNKAGEFVRLVLGVSSKNDANVGLDPGFMWNEDKSQRFLKTVHIGQDNVEVANYYTILKKRPYSRHEGIVGNGTSCWLGRDLDGKLVIIKDTWIPVHTGNRIPEAQLLAWVEDMEGISQMRTPFCLIDSPTSKLRGLSSDIYRQGPNKRFEARQYSRMIFEYAGKPLSDVTDPKEVLIAMRDAIAAHQRLWNGGILHRDISINNIVVNRDGQGILIDLSEAIWLKDDSIPEIAHYDTGTRPFQSSIVIRTVNDRTQKTTHDYFDDLESFFHVLCYIVIRNESARDRRVPTRVSPVIIRPWKEDKPHLEAISKERALRDDDIWRELTGNINPSFGPVFATLLKKYREFLKPMVLERLDSAASLDDPDNQRLTHKELREYSDVQYPMVLELFYEAIKAL